MRLTTDQELADGFGITLDKLHDLRKRQGWPHVRLTRFDFRFTDDQIAEIVRMRSVEGERAAGADNGLTRQSARRAS